MENEDAPLHDKPWRPGDHPRPGPSWRPPDDPPDSQQEGVPDAKS